MQMPTCQLGKAVPTAVRKAACAHLSCAVCTPVLWIWDVVSVYDVAASLDDLDYVIRGAVVALTSGDHGNACMDEGREPCVHLCLYGEWVRMPHTKLTGAHTSSTAPNTVTCATAIPQISQHKAHSTHHTWACWVVASDNVPAPLCPGWKRSNPSLRLQHAPCLRLLAERVPLATIRPSHSQCTHLGRLGSGHLTQCQLRCTQTPAQRCRPCERQ
jgi:hypothetical protein